VTRGHSASPTWRKASSFHGSIIENHSQGPNSPFINSAFIKKMGCQNFNSAFFFVFPVKNLAYTIWLFNIAMENGPFIDGLPIKNGDFPWLC